MSSKLTSCMKLVNSMDEQDQDALLDRLGQYQKDGIKPERAQLMAASDTLAELEAERKEFMAMLREQHPDIFRIKPGEEEDADSKDSSIKKSQARDVTETPEFKRWSEGLPVHNSFADRSSDRGVFKLYHMTTADFNEFKPGSLNPTDSGPAIWLSADPSATSAAFRVGNAERGFREGARTMPVYAKVKNPLVIDDAGMLDYAREAFADGSREFPQLISKSAAAALKEEGHDSVIFDGPGVGWKGASVEVIVFDGGQVKSIIGNSGAFDPDSKDIRKSTERNAMGFYSALAAGIDGMPTKSAPAGAWKAQIKGLVNKGAVKQDEVTWSGLEDWMDLQEGKITKEQIAEYLEQGGVRVEEVSMGYRSGDAPKQRLVLVPNGTRNDAWGTVYKYTSSDGKYAIENGVGGKSWQVELADNYDSESDYAGSFDSEAAVLAFINGEAAATNRDFDGDRPDTKYSQYTLPGGENYREVLLTLPSAADEGSDAIKRLRSATNETEYNAARDEIDRARSAQYKSSHWDQKNVLAHIRANDRTDADGAKTLFIEEVQSDFQQDYRKSREAIKRSVESDFEGIVERMKKAGVLEVACD